MIFTIGQPYPMAYPKTYQREWAVANLFASDFNSLLIGIKNPTQKDIDAITSNEIKVGVFYAQPIIMLMIQIGEEFAFDCSLDMKLIAEPSFIELDSPDTRLLMFLHLVDQNNTLIGMRAFTLPPEVTATLVKAAQYQLTLPYTKSEFTEKLAILHKLPTTFLIANTKMQKVGT